MLKNPPFGSNFPILQSFGDNPAGYADVTCGGVALRGHNGIDYADAGRHTDPCHPERGGA